MTTVTPRLSYEAFAKTAAHTALIALGKSIDESTIEKPLTELVKLRVSQINGCAFCIQFHLNIARRLTVAPEKLDLVAAWREAGVHSPREMAALEWAETLTSIGSRTPSDADYAAVLTEFSDAEAIHLTVTVGTINQWNRIAVGLRFAPPLPQRAA